MSARLGISWASVWNGLWFVPTAITLAAVALAFGMVQIDVLLNTSGPMWQYVAFGGGAEGARGVLTSIASTTITVAGVAFSITMVAMQLASSQFTPRVLHQFIGDRANHVVLGVFIGTFTYALLVLRTVRSAAENGAAFVPSLAVALAIVLALVSMGSLIYFIHHVARSMQVSVIIDRATRDTVRLIEELFPERQLGAPAGAAEGEARRGTSATVVAHDSGYVQAIDEDALIACGEDTLPIIRLEQGVGDFVLPGAPLASVEPPAAATPELVQGVRKAIVLGPERTLQYDVEFGIQQLADIAIRALSPGVNDPTTARQCVDRLAQILVILAGRDTRNHPRRGEDGRVRLIARGTSFASAVRLAFDQIRHFGSGDPTFAASLLDTLRRMSGLVPPDSRGPLRAQIAALDGAAREAEPETHPTTPDGPASLTPTRR